MSFAEPGLEIVPGLTLLEPLGRGGMGEAWLARDDERGEKVVAKVLPPNAPADRVALLRREARIGRKLTHPRIVPVYGFRSGDRGSALTLRYMRGGEARWRGGVPAGEVVRLGREVAEALEYLHGMGVVHRDVKASNVLLDEAGRAHLADFGIASVASGDEEGMVLRGGGSRASMSPQQRAGEKATPSDDLYALGAFLFELLSGGPPFPPGAKGEPAPAIAPPATSPSPMPDSLAALIASLLARSPGERPASASVVKERLAAIESGVASTPPAADGVRAAPPPVRLQPPPRVAEGGVMTPAPRPAPLQRSPPRSREGLSFSQINLLLGLGVASVAVVLWLPRWVEPPVAKPASVQAPTVVPSEAPLPRSAPPAETPLAATVSAPAEEPAVAASGRPRKAPMRSAPAELSPATPWAPAEPKVTTPAVEPTPDRAEEARALTRHRDSARAFEEKEEWSAAVREYEAALAVDRLVAFAIEGKERAGSRAALQAALGFHLRNRARLSTETVAREAETLLERARGIESSGPRHGAQIVDLERALVDARTTVAVQLESDGKTDLTVSRVGRLGTLTHRTVQLRPGTYTVVGSRPGYRDVRRQFTIAPRSPAQTVVVRCEEAI